MALEKRKLKSNGRSNAAKPSRTYKRQHFAVCVQGTGFDLLAQKVYRVVDDRRADELGCVRVIDESGEDYLYPANWFVLIRPDKNSERRLAAAIKTGA